MNMRIWIVISLLLCAPVGAAADSEPAFANPAPAHPELRPVLEQFGGEAGLKALMEDFMVLLVEDPRTGPFFVEIDTDRVKQRLVEQFCVILGGDCTYEGLDMVAAHADMGVTHADFNRLVELLQIAMDRHGIPTRAQNQLLAKLAPMHREIIEAPVEE